MSKERSCTSKVRYGHAETAYRAIEAMRAKKGEVLESYECEFCGGWHIGHAMGKAVQVTFKPGASRGEILAALESAGIGDDDTFNAVMDALEVSQ